MCVYIYVLSYEFLGVLPPLKCQDLLQREGVRADLDSVKTCLSLWQLEIVSIAWWDISQLAEESLYLHAHA